MNIDGIVCLILIFGVFKMFNCPRNVVLICVLILFYNFMKLPLQPVYKEVCTKMFVLLFDSN